MKEIISAFLGKLDQLIVRIAAWNHIASSKSNFLYLSPHLYKGNPIKLNDGTAICKGDWVAELHIDNLSIKTLDTRYPNLIRLLRGELLALKHSFQEGKYEDIAAVYGVSVFFDIAARQGFTIIDIQSPIKKVFASLWENILRLSFKKGNRKTRKHFIVSKECWLSKNQILNIN